MSDFFYVIGTEDGEEYYFKTVEARDEFLKSEFWHKIYEYKDSEGEPWLIATRKFDG